MAVIAAGPSKYDRSDSRIASSVNSAAAASPLPVSTAGPQLWMSRWIASWSSSCFTRASKAAMRSVTESPFGVEQVMMRLVNGVAREAGHGERVHAVRAAVIDDDSGPVRLVHPFDNVRQTTSLSL